MLTLFLASPALAAAPADWYGRDVRRSPVVVSCGPSQRAIVHDTFVRGRDVTRVECVSTRHVSYYRAARPHRSWGKTALIIGGSAGTGAGIGGIVHGKKGALIGAALGGGAASIYEGTRRR
jgi:hypothetical protein